MNVMYELIPHTADLQLRVYGDSLKSLFRNALVGMFQSIGPKTKNCSTKDGQLVCKTLPITREVALRAEEEWLLLVDFLSEALYLSDVYNEAYLDVTINEFDKTSLNAILHGIPVQGFEVVEIKAVTYHGLEIIQKDGQYQVDIIFDI